MLGRHRCVDPKVSPPPPTRAGPTLRLLLLLLLAGKGLLGVPELQLGHPGLHVAGGAAQAGLNLRGISKWSNNFSAYF